ncbi:uncharacterized protein LOC144107650 isoform X3 [Amblyomma americanum]
MKRRIRFTAMLITPLSSDLQDVSDAPSYDIGDQAPIAVDEEESGNDLIGWSSAIEDSESAGKMTEAEARRELSMALGSPIYEHSITVTVKKDDGFLAEYIPKLEGFYFKHLLRFLTH